ncbi:MAG: ATP-binding protein [Deltaproteobacteria bacterium]|nr:ATP-binding protein [Deltaproteobacteria bacterium]
MAGDQVDLLNSAFNTFRDASSKLEQQYALLERKIEDLNTEIAEKNRVMERTRRLAAMGEMAAKIAHEIRNPLGSMAIFATLLERELAHEPEKMKLAGHITKGIKTLDNLLSNMLLFASSPAARRRPVDIKEVIEDSILLARGREKEGVRIRCSHEGRTALMGDAVLLRQLFLNLLLNALDAIEEGGTIGISTAAPDDSLEIEVKDTGRGIDRAHLDRIFDPFFSTKERGTGLGLAIVSAIVSAHGGSIEAKSKPGRGTAFMISLPINPVNNVC